MQEMQAHSQGYPQYPGQMGPQGYPQCQGQGYPQYPGQIGPQGYPQYPAQGQPYGPTRRSPMSNIQAPPPTGPNMAAAPVQFRARWRKINNNGPVPVAPPSDFIQLTPIVQPIPLVPYTSQMQPLATFDEPGDYGDEDYYY